MPKETEAINKILADEPESRKKAAANSISPTTETCRSSSCSLSK